MSSWIFSTPEGISLWHNVDYCEDIENDSSCFFKKWGWKNKYHAFYVWYFLYYQLGKKNWLNWLVQVVFDMKNWKQSWKSPQNTWGLHISFEEPEMDKSKCINIKLFVQEFLRGKHLQVSHFFHFFCHCTCSASFLSIKKEGNQETWSNIKVRTSVGKRRTTQYKTVVSSSRKDNNNNMDSWLNWNPWDKKMQRSLKYHVNVFLLRDRAFCF